MRSLKCLFVLLASMTVTTMLLVAVACGKTPPSLSPTGARYYQADRGVVAIGNVQHVAIQLNTVRVCIDPAPCHPLLSDANTRVVVDVAADTLNTIKVAPEGWKVTLAAAIERINTRLDAAGKSELASYLSAARSIIDVF